MLKQNGRSVEGEDQNGPANEPMEFKEGDRITAQIDGYIRENLSAHEQKYASSRLATGQIGRNERHRISVHEHLTLGTHQIHAARTVGTTGRVAANPIQQPEAENGQWPAPESGGKS